MGWKVIFPPRSERDLAKIVSYIAEDDPKAAIRFGETLITKAESLGDAPEIGAMLPGKPTIRFLPVDAYLIIYRPDKNRRVVHSEILAFRASSAPKPVRPIAASACERVAQARSG